MPQTVWITSAYNPGISEGGLATRIRQRRSPNGDLKMHILNCLHAGFDRAQEFAEETPWSVPTVREAITHLVNMGFIRRCRIQNTVGRAMRYELILKEKDANT